MILKKEISELYNYKISEINDDIIRDYLEANYKEIANKY